MTTRTSKKKRSAAGAHTERGQRYIELPIDEVKDDPRNENVHTDEQIVLLRASIRLYGQEEDILIDRNNVCIAGHGIKRAMQLEGCKTISCKYSDLKGAKRAAYRIAANQLARLSHFDPRLLEKNARQISKQMGKEFEPSWLGLEPAEWQAILDGHNWKGRSVDPTAIGDYDPEQETFLIKIENVLAADKDSVLQRLSRALKGTSYEARAY
jgi:hypothetical protein